MDATESQLADPNSRRRRFQFSLRTLLLVMLLASLGASWFAVKMRMAKRQREAVRAMRKLGGCVIYDYECVDPAVPLGPEWLHSVLGEDYFGTVLYVYLKNTQATDAAMAHLEGMSQLRSLGLDRTQVTDAGLAHLETVNQLQKLYLVDTHITDAGLNYLVGMTELMTLQLDSTRITDAGLAHLKGMKQLRLLTCRGTRVTAHGVNDLRQALPRCCVVW